MKRLTIISFLLVFLPLIGNAQMHERGKKNFFLEPEISHSYSNSKKSAYSGNPIRFSPGLSGGRIFANFFKVGVVYRYCANKIVTWKDTTFFTAMPVGKYYEDVDRHYAGIKAELMFPFLRFNLGKSKRHECKSLTNFLMLGPEFGYNIASVSENNSYKVSSTNFLLCASWGFLLKNSGSNKKQAANDVFLCINMKHGQNTFAQRVSDGQKFYSTYWGISILWVKYKTGNWLR